MTPGPVPGVVSTTEKGSFGKRIAGESSLGDKRAEANNEILDAVIPGRKMTRFYEETAAKQAEEAARLKAEMEAKGRPTMDAEVSRIQQMLGMAKDMARTGTPEEAYMAQLSNIQQTGQGALNAASSRGAGMNMLGTIQGNQLGAMRELGAQDAMMQRQGQNTVMNTMQALSGAEGRAEGYNELMPYEQLMQQYQALTGAGMQNDYMANYFPYANQMQYMQFGVDLAGAGIGAAGNAAGGASSAAGSVAGAAIASDTRLKTNINEVSTTESGIKVFEFSYTKSPERRYRGTMAQHLLEIGRGDAVSQGEDGFYKVDYSKLDVDFTDITE